MLDYSGMGAPRFDPATATRLLSEGQTVLQVAHHLKVSPQAIYFAIRAGRVEKPSAAAA